MSMTKERRKNSPDHDTKRTIVSTVAIVTAMLVFAIILLALNQVPVPDQLDRLANIVLGALIGFLAKTSVDAVSDSTQRVVVENAPSNPVPTEPVNEDQTKVQPDPELS